jgi:asparagine synthase (glutamine-hydrolysing)
MCWITGFISSSSALASDEYLLLLQCMGNTLAHRGPDDSGTWYDREAGIGFAHRRLSIVDLSLASHQPMLSGSERYVIRMA